MKICIYGAGAIGGYLGALLARAGSDVTLIARGPHLEAMRRNGLRLELAGESFVSHPKLAADPAEAGPQDVVFMTMKAHAAPAVVDAMAPMLGTDTAVVAAANGVPWWYFYKLAGPWEDRPVKSVDPEGKLWRVIGPERAIGCVIYPACEVIEPGVVRHINNDRFSLGEPSGERSGRVVALAQAMIKAGLKVPVRPRIRDEIWVKLWGSVSFNPISALTGATLEQIAGDPAVRSVARAMMLEAKVIGEKLGVAFTIDVEQRIDGAGAIGAHRTSMLQDLAMGRKMEIDALVTAVQEMGRMVGVATPAIDAVLALVQQRARLAGCY